MKLTRPRLGSAAALAAVVLLSGCAGDEPPEAPPSSQPPTGAPEDDDTPEDEPEDEPAPGSNPEGSPERVHDCVAGTWEIDKSSDHWDVPFGDADEVSGTIYMHFDPVSGFMLEYDDVRSFTTIVEEAEATVRVDWNGSTVGEYEVDDDGLVSLTVIDADITVSTENHTLVGTEEDEYTVGIPIEMVYQCEGERLVGYPVDDPGLEHAWAVYDLVDKSFD